MLGIVREEEKGPETQRDEGTEDEEEDELLGEPQRSSVVRKGGGARRQGGDPSARQGQQRRRGHGWMWVGWSSSFVGGEVLGGRGGAGRGRREGGAEVHKRHMCRSSGKVQTDLLSHLRVQASGKQKGAEFLSGGATEQQQQQSLRHPPGRKRKTRSRHPFVSCATQNLPSEERLHCFLQRHSPHLPPKDSSSFLHPVLQGSEDRNQRKIKNTNKSSCRRTRARPGRPDAPQARMWCCIKFEL